MLTNLYLKLMVTLRCRR